MSAAAVFAGLRRRAVVASSVLLLSLEGAFATLDLGDRSTLCGISKRPLENDPVRRECLRQCIVHDDGAVAPVFSAWEGYCRETAIMDNWDAQCEAYLCCTFGCAVYGYGREVCLNARGKERRNMLVDAQAEAFEEGLTQEKRCELEKCHAWCARESFGTCREQQFKVACLASNPDLYGCDVDCSLAALLRPSSAVLLLLLAAVARG
eukprot:TRINITY_DN5372_c0_g1_i2.p1 TRINITY_DN5372_c0_g1~~TRINITY_DN5372_c0_g1_i2.p1  ORF type:complete len:207 (-),score=37.40 TRINITY_DN5372_c0_g1_i2:58-678(-)